MGIGASMYYPQQAVAVAKVSEWYLSLEKRLLLWLLPPTFKLAGNPFLKAVSVCLALEQNHGCFVQEHAV